MYIYVYTYYDTTISFMSNIGQEDRNMIND